LKENKLVSTGTKYNVYRHSKTSEYVVRTLSYGLPDILHGHVDVVTPTTYFGTMRSMKATSFLQPEIKAIDSDVNVVDTTSCTTQVTPSCLRALYKTSSYIPNATTTNKLGIVGYLEEYANYADLQVCPSAY
jgi:tripeptidyl-peptidase I